MKKFYLIVCLLSVSSVSHAQFFSIGEDYKSQSRKDSIIEPFPHGKSKNECEFSQQMRNIWMSVSMPLDRMNVTSEYGMRNHPILGKTMDHHGIDYGVPVGSNVYAMMDGVVSRTGYDKRSGKYIVLAHGEYDVSYCHLSSIFVKKGEHVKAGQVVSLSGNTGRWCTGPHLHYGLKHNGQWCNPNILLTKIKETRLFVLQKLEQYSKEDV